MGKTCCIGAVARGHCTCTPRRKPAPKCPDCNEEIRVDCTPEMNKEEPYERVCFACGWFDTDRYATREAAEAVRP